MQDTYYDTELRQLGKTYEDAKHADIEGLKIAIAGASESSIIGVGSGGSFTVASLLCNLHESYTGRVSRPSTPLEIICNPTLASSSPVFLISAEGKNPDILEALERARRHSSRAVHVLTNRASSPLTQLSERLTNITPHLFPLDKKDGYLATNSLLLDATLVARAYGELNNGVAQLPNSIDELKIGGKTIDGWLKDAESFVTQAAPRKGLIVVYSPLLRPIATDLESKMSEAALMYCQLADLRSFAHGRHLWMAERAKDCAILSLTEPGLEGLWESMRNLMPAEVPIFTMQLAGSSPEELLCGLIAQMKLVSMFAHELKRDPGKPLVPEFGKSLYYIDLPSLIPAPQESASSVEQSKYDVLGARWPITVHGGAMRRALEAFESTFRKQKFKAIVFDYDGTLCSSQRKNAPPSEEMINHLEALAKAGILVGIASGRGGSLQEALQKCISNDLWERFRLGLYNGGWIGHLGSDAPQQGETSEFLSHVQRIVGRLQSLGIPIERIKETHPHQVSIRFREGINAESMWFVVADALKQAGLDPSTVVRSKHSVDVLANGVSKSHLVADIVQEFSLDPYEVVTMGDQGAWPGNDSALLEHRYSLSVDQPSRRLDRGWKLAPKHKRDVDATLWYLERINILPNGLFRFDLKN